jgi:hypothetical protein
MNSCVQKHESQVYNESMELRLSCQANSSSATQGISFMWKRRSIFVFRSSQLSVPFRLTHQKPVSVASNACHKPLKSELLQRTCNRECWRMLCDIFLFVGCWVKITSCLQFWMEPWYSFRNHLHRLPLHCLYNRFSFMLRNSCIWMQCCLCTVRRRDELYWRASNAWWRHPVPCRWEAAFQLHARIVVLSSEPRPIVGVRSVVCL